MGRAIGLIVILATALLLFHVFGLYPEDVDTPIGLIMDAVRDPTSLRDFDIFSGVSSLLTLLSLTGATIAIGTFIATKNELAIRAAFGFTLLGILWEFLVLFNGIKSYSNEYIAGFTVGILMIMFLIVIMEWVSGRD